MKKLILLFMVLLLMFFSSVVLAVGNDFRNVNWEDGIDKVKKAEQASFLDQSSLDDGRIRLRYATAIENYKANLVYIFDKNKNLASATYVFDESATNVIGYNEMNKKFYNILTAKYGKSVNSKEGILTIEITWKNANTVISLKYHKTDSEDFLNLTYISYESIQRVGEGL